MKALPEATASQVKRIDDIMARKLGVSAEHMMELAGFLAARACHELFEPGEVLVLAGKGNNAGDGLVAARHLHNLGIRTVVVPAGEMHKELPLKQLETVKELGIPVKGTVAGSPDLVLDALLGFGAKGEPRGGVALCIREAKKLGVPVLSLDVPSGYDCSAGKWFKPCFENSTVLTLGLPKKGMLKDRKIKSLYVGDIGIPREAWQQVGLDVPPVFRDSCYFKIR